MTNTPRTMATLLAAAVLLSFLASCSPSHPRFAFKHGERRGRLDSNGLRFVVMPDVNTELIEVDVRYEVGSREDPPGKAGLAHLVEHMMFQHRPDGPQTKPLMHFLTQATVFMNAYTNWDSTHYMVTARPEQLDSIVKVEAIRLKLGCETLTEEEFLREREVVRNEIRGGHRSPEGMIPQLAMSAIYPKGHAYEQMIGGDDQQLANITFGDVCDFMKKYYVPERATVIIAGKVAVEEAVNSVSKWFGLVEKRPAAPRRKVDPVQVTASRKVVELAIERPYVTVGWALPDASTPEGENAMFGVWGAFFDAAVKADKYECATNSQPVLLGGQHAPVFLIALELKGIDRVDECLDFVWKAARKAHRGWDEGTWEQLEEAKNRRKAQFISSFEQLSGRTNSMGDLVQFTRDVDFDSQELFVFHELDKIGKLDPARIASAVKRALDPDRARVVVFKPSTAGIKGDKRAKLEFKTKSHDKVEQPDVDPTEARKPFRVDTQLKAVAGATRYNLGNGMRVVLLPIDSFPVITAQLVFDAGTAVAPENPWLASQAAEFLSLPLDAQAVARAGVEQRCRATSDHTICTSRGMNIYLDVVVKGLERLIKAGVYDQETVENWQKRQKLSSSLKRAQQDLEFQRQTLAAVFGPEHPYTKTGAPNPAAVSAVGRDRLSAFRDKHYTARNATLIIVGAFDVAKAKSLISDSFGDWDGGHKDQPVARDLAPRNGPVYVGVVGEQDPQIDVAIAYPSPPGIDGQHAARLVLAEMLNSRMWDIRAKLGATYGTYARRDTRVGPSAYRLGGAVDAPRAGEAIKAMRDGLEGLRQGTDFELLFARARRKLIQTMLSESTVTAELAWVLGEMARYHLDPNYQNNLLQQIAAVSIAQVKALLAAELDPAHEAVVLRGDRESLLKAFSEAGIQDVKLVEPEYK